MPCRIAAPSGWLALDGSIRSITAVTRDWANSGTGPPAGCPAGTVDVGGAGGLFNCGVPGAAGAPPSPPALTPAAAADPSIISAVFTVDPISGDTTNCGTGDPTVIAGGGKNGDPINSYSLTTQSVPAKDDLGELAYSQDQQRHLAGCVHDNLVGGSLSVPQREPDPGGRTYDFPTLK